MPYAEFIAQFEREQSLLEVIRRAVDKWIETNGKLSVEDVSSIAKAYANLLPVPEMLFLFERLKYEKFK